VVALVINRTAVILNLDRHWLS